MLDEGPKMPKPPSPKFDPRSGLSYAQQQALHIDHGPPLPPEPEPFNPGMVDHGIGAPPLPANPYLPPNDFPHEQTPSDYSFSTNHSDPGYLSGQSGSSFGRNQFAGHNNNQFAGQNNNQFGGNFGGGNQAGHFDFGNRSQIPPPQSPFVKPGGFGGTPLSYDSGMSQPTPMTPQTPQPPLQNEVQERSYDNRERSGRNRDKRDRDRGNNSKSQDYDRNRNKNSDWGRDGYSRDNRYRDKGRRDWKYERDNEYSRREREREKERERNRNSDRDRRRNDFRESRNDERENSRDKIVEKEMPKEEPYIPTPPPQTFPPKPAEPKEEEEPRSMSLESRIQSLLSGFRSPEPAKTQPKEETPPPATPKVAPPPPSEDTQSGFEKSNSSSDLVSLNKTPVYNETPVYNQTPVYSDYSAPGHDSNQGWPNTYPNGPLPVNSVPPPQDDEDRMSLDSNDSGGGNTSIEINPQAMKPDIPLVPSGPLPLMSLPTKATWPQSSANTFDMGSYAPPQNANINCFDYMSGTYNQNYINQYNNELNNQETEKEGEMDEVSEKTERTFNNVLEDFVDELKEILMKDLCKKMVENSGFKYYDRWWDREEEKTKVMCFTLFCIITVITVLQLEFQDRVFGGGALLHGLV